MFNVQSHNKISTFLVERITAGDFPSAVYLVAEKGKIKFADALGLAVKTNEIEIPARIETIYDLASLTKVLVTGLLCAKLIEKNEINLGRLIDYYLPEFTKIPELLIDGAWDTSIGELLTHSSNFAAWRPFYLLTDNRQEVLKEIIKTPLNWEQKSVTYSDLNFLVLTFLLEKIYDKRLDQIAQAEIFAPLSLQNTFFNPPKELQNKISASEFGNFYEKQTCREMGFDIDNFAWRNNLIWGEVHDGNCWFMNGVSGHAGLFSTAEEVFKIALQFLPNSTTLLKPETCDLFKTNFTPNLNEARSFAFELAATENSTASNALKKNSFGHLGFTGTSLWIEPERERIFILLTNRTHHSLPFVNINSTRRKFHELATQLLDKS